MQKRVFLFIIIGLLPILTLAQSPTQLSSLGKSAMSNGQFEKAASYFLTAAEKSTEKDSIIFIVPCI
jgi:hypothetical protein